MTFLKMLVLYLLMHCCAAEPIQGNNDDHLKIFEKIFKEYDFVYILEYEQANKKVAIESIKIREEVDNSTIVNGAIEELRLVVKYDKRIKGSLIFVSRNKAQITTKSDFFDESLITRRNNFSIKDIRAFRENRNR